MKVIKDWFVDYILLVLVFILVMVTGILALNFQEKQFQKSREKIIVLEAEISLLETSIQELIESIHRK